MGICYTDEKMNAGECDVRYRAVVFDMDGTILDTLEDLRDSVNEALAWGGFAARTTEEIRSFVGNGAARLIERAVPAGSDDGQVAKVLAYYRAYYEAHAQIKTTPYPGIQELLENLRAQGVRLAVVSNKPDAAVKKLAAHYFPHVFHAAVGARDGVPVKPSPESVWAALELLDVPAEESVYVGDSDVDIMTAQNAGMDGIAVAWGFRGEAFLRDHGAKVIVRSAEELAERL